MIKLLFAAILAVPTFTLSLTVSPDGIDVSSSSAQAKNRRSSKNARTRIPGSFGNKGRKSQSTSAASRQQASSGFSGAGTKLEHHSTSNHGGGYYGCAGNGNGNAQCYGVQK
jgi:hypothetical protein